MERLFKFGTALSGFTSGVYGPFKCAHCTFSTELGDEHICENPNVEEDEAVHEDEYGNKIIHGEDCCNFYTPKDLEKKLMLDIVKSTNSNLDEIQIFCPLVKVDAAKREVWGVVTAEEPDKDNEICDYATTAPYYEKVVKEMSKATDGANIFPLRAMHGLIAAGKGISIEFRKEAKEVYMGFKVVDDTEWKKVQENVYTGFSQGGRYIKKWKDGDYTRYTAAPGEVSLVDMPCCTRAHFDYIKADGSVELRKFSKTEATDIGSQKEGELPTSVGHNINAVSTACTCACQECKAGSCPECSADSKCAMSAKAVRFLVQGHLPYTKQDGKPDHRLMGAAWAALHGGYRGNKYEGPNKAKAIKRLKQLYAQIGKDTPAEKAVIIEPILQELLKDCINKRAYGYLGKGLYTVSRFAQLVEDMKYLWMSLEYEREQEGDESPVTDELKETFSSMLDHMLDYTEEQLEEERAKLKVKS